VLVDNRVARWLGNRDRPDGAVVRPVSLTRTPVERRVAAVVASDASLSGTAAGAAPTVADVGWTVALADPVVRNLQITQCYCELSRAFATRTGGGPANWCTFATWASKQAGQTIRKEDLARTFERLFGRSREARGAGNAAVASMGELRQRAGPERVWDALSKALSPSDAFERASDAVARGNRKVFEEIGLEFARFLALPRSGGAVDTAALAAFCDGLRPGDPPAGQGLLRQAFRSYAAALVETDPKARAELILLANLAIGFHEQTRLEPEIAEALEAPLEEPVRLRRDLLRELVRSRLGGALRLLWELLPGRSSDTKRALDELDHHVKRIAREAVTEMLMTLSLPGQTLSLGADVPGGFPPDLRRIDNPELAALLGRIDPTPDTTRGSGAEDWSNLSQRIHYIADLFRVYQERPPLLSEPFTAEQVAVIKAGGRPAGRL
jgi:hypothetical protein